MIPINSIEPSPTHPPKRPSSRRPPGVPCHPASALTRSNQQPAVWVVDPAALTVSLRPVEIKRHGEDFIAVSGGLETGDIVVTAGVQALVPGQKVRLPGSQP